MVRKGIEKRHAIRSILLVVLKRRANTHSFSDAQAYGLAKSICVTMSQISFSNKAIVLRSTDFAQGTGRLSKCGVDTVWGEIDFNPDPTNDWRLDCKGTTINLQPECCIPVSALVPRTKRFADKLLFAYLKRLPCFSLLLTILVFAPWCVSRGLRRNCHWRIWNCARLE
jgi:hypothetical protein